MPEASIVAGVVIRNAEGKYLLVQERKEPFNGLWGFPGGHVDPGETFEQAAIREALEEVGLTVGISDEKPLLVAKLIHHDKTYYAYRAEITSGELMIDPSELLDAQWLSLDKITEMDRTHKTREPMVLQAVIEAEKL